MKEGKIAFGEESDARSGGIYGLMVSEKDMEEIVKKEYNKILSDKGYSITRATEFLNMGERIVKRLLDKGIIKGEKVNKQRQDEIYYK